MPAEYCSRTALLDTYHRRLIAAGALQPGLSATIEATDGASTVAIPAGLCAIWRTAPPEENRWFFRSHASASVAIQATLRREVFAHWLRNPDSWPRIESACAMFTYSASMPCYGHKPEFTHDFLSRRWFASAFHFARKPLNRLLAQASVQVRNAGAPNLADVYQILNAREMLLLFRARRAPLRRIFAREERVLNQVFAVGKDIGDGRNSNEVAALLATSYHVLQVRLRRLACGDGMAPALLVFVEATRALAERVAVLEDRRLLSKAA